MHVQMSRSDLGSVAEPVAFFNLSMDMHGQSRSSYAAAGESATSGGGKQPAPDRSNLPLEFTKPQLMDFLRQLDRMQTQLDALGS